MSAWQIIDTAPQDDRFILLFVPNGVNCEATRFKGNIVIRRIPTPTGYRK